MRTRVSVGPDRHYVLKMTAFLLCASQTALAGQISFVEPQALPLALRPGTGDGIGSVAAADFDGDGRFDIAVTYGIADHAYVGVLLNNGNGSFQAPIGQEPAYPNGPYALIARDFNGDHMMDLAVTIPGLRQVFFYPGRGDGTFGTPIATSVPHRLGALQAGDLNGDGTFY